VLKIEDFLKEANKAKDYIEIEDYMSVDRY
jgi:hypothetical protein